MKERETVAIILAAGQSTRMNSSFSKVLHKIYGKPMLEYVLDAIKPLGVKKIILITNNKDDIKKNCALSKNMHFIPQKKLLGTAHAVMQTKDTLIKFEGDLLILYGDTPLLKTHTLQRLLEKHKGSLAACTLLTTFLKEPGSYGRIVRDSDDNIKKIIEARDASAYEKTIREINAGVYCFRSKELFKATEVIKPDNKKGEYYLTDTIEILSKKGFGIESLQTDVSEEITGVNSRQDLARAQEFTKNRILDEMMSKGVGIIDPITTHIYNDVEIGQDTIIYPFTVIESNVSIGKKCKIGPFARIRPYTEISDEVEIGNFTEITRSKIGERTRIKHRTFLGDAEIGSEVNIDAGTTTANYDGINFSKTKIGNRSFIGSGTTIIAPAVIGDDVTTGAGSVIARGEKIPHNSTIHGVPAKVYKKTNRRNSHE